MRARVLGVLLAEENRKWVTLAAVSFGLFMIMLDNTVVNVALPTMEKDLHVTLASLEWVVIAYALTFASLLITGGKLADMYGRRRIFVVGLAVFTLSSLACGLAPSASFLIGARAVQGVGAALMNPATLSIIVATFPPRQRGQAIGIWAGVSALALAIGPLGGGLIVDNLNWNWIFFVNVPVGVLGIAVSQFAIRESRDTSHEQSIDLPGLLTSAGFLFSLSYALVEGNSHGWTSPEILGLFATAAVLLVAFIVVEKRQRLAMLDLSLFKIGAFTGSNVVAMLVSLSMFGVFFFVSLYIQNILGYSATQAGAAFLPMVSLIILIAPLSGRLSDRIGSRWLMGGGMTLVGLSLLLYERVTVHSDFWTLLPSMILGGVGMAMTMSPMTSAAMGAVPVDKAGVGSGVLNSFRQVGGSRPVRGRPRHRGHVADRGVLHVLVVLADEHDGRLPDRGHVQGLVERPDVRGPVAEEADRHLPGLAVLRGPRGPERDRQVRPDDRVRAHRVVLDAGQVHRPALAAEEARPAPEQLGEDRRHRHAPGERVVVAAVGAERVVVVAHRRRDPGRHGLLADAEVGRAAHEALEEQLLGAHLEQAALLHRPVHPQLGGPLDVGRGRRHRLVSPSTRWRRTARPTGTS